MKKKLTAEEIYEKWETAWHSGFHAMSQRGHIIKAMEEYASQSEIKETEVIVNDRFLELLNDVKMQYEASLGSPDLIQIEILCYEEALHVTKNLIADYKKFSSPVVKQEANTISDEEIRLLIDNILYGTGMIKKTNEVFYKNWISKFRQLLSKGEIKKEQGTIEPKKPLSEITDDFKEIKIGDFLTAIDECKMNIPMDYRNISALIIGKKYEVISDDGQNIGIHSEYTNSRTEHYFDRNSIHKYFSKVEEQKKGG